MKIIDCEQKILIMQLFVCIKYHKLLYDFISATFYMGYNVHLSKLHVLSIYSMKINTDNIRNCILYRPDPLYVFLGIVMKDCFAETPLFGL